MPVPLVSGRATWLWSASPPTSHSHHSWLLSWGVFGPATRPNKWELSGQSHAILRHCHTWPAGGAAGPSALCCCCSWPSPHSPSRSGIGCTTGGGLHVHCLLCPGLALLVGPSVTPLFQLPLPATRWLLLPGQAGKGGACRSFRVGRGSLPLSPGPCLTPPLGTRLVLSTRTGTYFPSPGDSRD